VRQDESDNGSWDEPTIAAFAERLDAYASTLSERERDALKTLLLRAMDPLERMRWRDTSMLLDPREEALLQALAGEEWER
jgi:hypothetical protein